ncbi:MAG TPA: CBS domain-containing protein [Saprospiraceae bacterium]|nr:CBS domain-containing protein [Saprospiraceae bacterium]HMP23100.1 CBS domain-containing protein [Saprospiraceae bacterium]
MGEKSVKSALHLSERNEYLVQVLHDIKALDIMLHEKMFEKGKQRIGAEQELCLIHDDGSPALTAPDILGAMTDPHFTTEIGKFNMEINLDPFELRSDCLRNSERQLMEMLATATHAASDADSNVLLTGILPSLTHLHLEEDCMAPVERYHILSNTMRKMRGRDFEIHIIGVDELIASNPSILFEACNTSFQLHLQIDPDEFVEHYNWAQMISGPVLAACTNSPLLFGRELWAETRIALFQQSVDTRSYTGHLRERQSRVYFGNRWLRDSVAEVFKEHLTRFPMVFSTNVEQNSMDLLREGKTPKLRALQLHNGTVYTWNRICYGISEGWPHLRIECRYIPAGPTISDEMANFALWLGLLKGMPDRYRKLQQIAEFRSAKDNFYRAARVGINAGFDWLGKNISAERLLLDELLPIAQSGLEKAGVNTTDIARYLGIIEARILRQQNGAQWQVHNFRCLRDAYGAGVAVNKLTRTMHELQETGAPVHTWDPVDCRPIYTVNIEEDTVDKVMSTDLFTVREEEPLALIKSIMEWKNIRHLPVENQEGDLVGLVTATNVRAFMSLSGNWEQMPIKNMMVKNIVTITADTPVKSAIQMMQTFGLGCLPIVRDSQLLGIITDTDVKRILEAMGDDSAGQ